MAIRNTNYAESWEAIYQAFGQVNFSAFDQDTVKQSLIDYCRIYHGEDFNNFIESDEFVMFLGVFSYFAELLAYRIDMNANENFITTAQRKQSLLKLAKIISYKVSRNIPARGVMKISSISTSEDLYDSLGNSLKNVAVNWNDPNNTNWKEQFFLIFNRTITTEFGIPSKIQTVNGVVNELYTFNNVDGAFSSGVFPFSAKVGNETIPLEITPADVDENGPFERTPDLTSQMSVIYSTDGYGDSSDYTGFLLFCKQGSLSKISYPFTSSIPNRTIDVGLVNVNETDVWVQRVDANGNILEQWEQVDNVNEENLLYNTINSTRKKYEVESLENNKVRLIFGSGDFSDIPVGTFNIWVRQSVDENVVIPKSKIQNVPMTFSYTSEIGRTETVSLVFSAVSALQNAAASESVDRIRTIAPTTYYSQNRMVNGQDYNTYPLKDQSILKIKTVNRTFAGQPKYIDWHDASSQYENVKIFGDDLGMTFSLGSGTISSSDSARSLIDATLEPILSSSAIKNVISHVLATSPDTQGVVTFPRSYFIEDARNIFTYTPTSSGVSTTSNLKEKTIIQGALDRHFYGEPTGYVAINGITHAIIPNPTKYPQNDGLIYDANVPRTIDGISEYPPGDPGSGLQALAAQPKFGLRFVNDVHMVGNGSISGLSVISSAGVAEVWTLQFASDQTTIFVSSNIRGTFTSSVVGSQYSLVNSSAPMDFTISAGSVAFQAGDAFIIRIAANGTITSTTTKNLYGRWELIDGATLGNSPNSLVYDPSVSTAASWVIWVEVVKKNTKIVGFNIHYRDLKLIVSSEKKHTKFWFNDLDKLMDSDTQNKVYDQIKILRSNLDASGKNLTTSQPYDVIGGVVDSTGVSDIYSLEVMPSGVMTASAPISTVLQFEEFSSGAFKYFLLANPSVTYNSIQTGWLNGAGVQLSASDFRNGSFADTSQTYGRIPYRGSLDFLWQHFSPYTNLIDPSQSNINDAYILSQGYFTSVMDYVSGKSTDSPIPPTPLELRTSYAYLYEKKMLSDTMIFHPGKVKLLFGSLAQSELKAKFVVVKQSSASYSDERVKLEIIKVVNAFFDINRWDFGTKFYATELIAEIHKQLGSQIASVVLVPKYSANSFGSLFVITPNNDEVLQSCASVADVEIVAELTASNIRQN